MGGLLLTPSVGPSATPTPTYTQLILEFLEWKAAQCREKQWAWNRRGGSRPRRKRMNPDSRGAWEAPTALGPVGDVPLSPRGSYNLSHF